MAQRQYGFNPNDSRTGISTTSGIPLPPSAMKSTNYLQQSSSSNPGGVAQQRMSIVSGRPTSRSNGPRKSNFGVPVAVTRGGAGAGGASSSRGASSLQPSSQQQFLGASQSQGWEHARTPMKSSTANNNFASSVAGGSVNRRSTLGGGAGTGLGASSVSRSGRSGPATAASRAPLRDARPTRDAAWQKMAQMEIYDYLMENKSDMELSFLTLGVLRSPTSKQFEEIWKFLVLELDPDWVPENQKVQEEFVPVMKDLQYPFAEAITKSSLSAINSPHSWAAITAALHWMVRQARIKGNWLFDNNTDVYVMDVNDIDPLSDAAEVRHVLEFDFLAKSYTKFFLEGEGADYSEEEEQLRERYKGRFDMQDEMSTQYEKKISQIMQQIETHRSQPTPLEAAKAQLDEQEAKAKGYVANRQNTLSAVQKNRKICEKYRGEVQIKTEELQRLLAEQKRMRRIIQEQNLSEEDIRRITNEEDQLRKTVTQLTEKLNEARKALADLEVQVTRKSEEADDLLTTYETLLTEFGLFTPGRPPPEPISHVNLEITLDTAKADAQAMTNGADVRGIIRPALLAYRSAKATEGVELSSSNDDLAAALEKLQSETEDILERIREHEDQRRQIEQSIEIAKTMMNQEVERARAANAELERSAREIEDDLNAGRGARHAELTNLQIEYESVKAKVFKYKEELREAIIAKCADMVKVVNTSSMMLQDLEVAADASEARTSTTAAMDLLSTKSGAVPMQQ